MQLSVYGALVDVKSANVNVQGVPVDLNAPVNVQGTDNSQSAPLIAESAPSTVQSVPLTGDTPDNFSKCTNTVQGQWEPLL